MPDPATDRRAEPEASYDGRRVLVTGGAGFIGHHLVAALTARGADALVVDDLSAGRSERLPPSVRLEELDVATGDVAGAFDRWRPAIVFHLAAQVSVPRSEAAPEHDLRVNGFGTLRVALAAREAAVGRLVFVSSGGAIYGETPEPATEDAPTVPDSYYGSHKLLAEHYVARSGLSHAVARPSNIYGPGQDAIGEGAVVATFTDAAREGRPITIHGDGTQERDFLHVTDLVDALLLLGSDARSGTWNASFGSSRSIGDLAAIVERIAGRPLPRTSGPRRPGDIHLSRIDSDRLRGLGWAPRVSLEDGLGELVRTGR